MMFRSRILLLLLTSTVLTLASGSSLKPASAEPKEASLDQLDLTTHSLSRTVTTHYLLLLPNHYQSSSARRWPLILFLHGIGECGTNIWETVVHGPIKYAEKHPGFPFILVSPQCPVGQKWSDQSVLDVLDQVIARYNVDTNRIYLTGLSLGGFGVWSLATTYPERFAAVAPISGGGDTLGFIIVRWNRRWVDTLQHLPVWAFHGAKDPVVPVSEDKRMVATLRKFGDRNVKLTIDPNGLHDVWTETYDNPKLYQWFLEHRLASGAAH